MTPKTHQKEKEERKKKKGTVTSLLFNLWLKIFIHDFCAISGTTSGTINNETCILILKASKIYGDTITGIKWNPRIFYYLYIYIFFYYALF